MSERASIRGKVFRSEMFQKAFLRRNHSTDYSGAALNQICPLIQVPEWSKLRAVVTYWCCQKWTNLQNLIFTILIFFQWPLFKIDDPILKVKPHFSVTKQNMKIGPIPVANHLHYYFSIDISLRVDSVLGGHSRGGYSLKIQSLQIRKTCAPWANQTRTLWAIS